MNPISDADDDVYLKKSGIDTSVGYLIGGILVALFFLLTILGMGRIQTMSDVSLTPNRFNQREKATEIGDTQPVDAKN